MHCACNYQIYSEKMYAKLLNIDKNSHEKCKIFAICYHNNHYLFISGTLLEV